ncbi:MAG: isochorismatase family cysteine hydrolase [Nitratireductor sp.]
MSEPALIVIDMQNSFLHPKGENYYPAAGETIEPVRRLLDAARTGKRLIVHTLDRHRRGLVDFEQKRLPEHCLEGGFDAAYFEGFGPLADAPREVEIVKRRYSAFFATDLGLMLRENGVEAAIICGVKTNVCVRATSQDAFANGFRVVVPRQATNSNRANLQAASLEDIDRYLGHVVELDEALSQLAGGSDG